MDKTYSIEEAAEIMEVSVSTMRHVAGREIPIIYGKDRVRRITEKALKEYMETDAYQTLPHNRRQPKPEPSKEYEMDIPDRPNGKPLLSMHPPKPQVRAQNTYEPSRPSPLPGPLTAEPPRTKRKTAQESRYRQGTTVIHTDNPDVVDWLAERGIEGFVISGPLTVHDVKNRDLICAVAPPYILAEARSITTIRAPGINVREATLMDLQNCGAYLVSYSPPKEIPPIWD